MTVFCKRERANKKRPVKVPLRNANATKPWSLDLSPTAPAVDPKRSKEPGWEELIPKFMLTPEHIRLAMISCAMNGKYQE